MENIGLWSADDSARVAKSKEADPHTATLSTIARFFAAVCSLQAPSDQIRGGQPAVARSLQAISANLCRWLASHKIPCLLALCINAAHAQTLEQANVIENVVALHVAQSKCGHKVNSGMLAIVLSATGLHEEDLMSGGKYWGSIERNHARVQKLIATDSGKASFCRNVRRDLSAMFD